MAAGTCLSLLAQTVADAIVPAVIPFIEANIKSSDWHQREAAIMTFGSILDGPDPTVLSPLVDQALPVLIEMTRDTNLLVKDTVAWTLGRICDLLIVTIKPDVHLHPLVSALVQGLEDKPRIIANCCWALMNLSDQLGSYYEDENAPQPSASPLQPYYEGIVQALLKVTDGFVMSTFFITFLRWLIQIISTGNESNFRTSAYEALASYITHASPESLPIIQNTAVTVLTRMQQLLSMQVSEILPSLCDVIHFCSEPITRCGRPKQLERAAEQLMQRAHCE